MGVNSARDTRPSKLRASLDDDEVLACPECDSTAVRGRLNPEGRGAAGQPEDWGCERCEAFFDAPTIREWAGFAESGLSGMAKVLDETDPEEVGL